MKMINTIYLNDVVSSKKEINLLLNSSHKVRYETILNSFNDPRDVTFDTVIFDLEWLANGEDSFFLLGYYQMKSKVFHLVYLDKAQFLTNKDKVLQHCKFILTLSKQPNFNQTFLVGFNCLQYDIPMVIKAITLLEKDNIV